MGLVHGPQSMVDGKKASLMCVTISIHGLRHVRELMQMCGGIIETTP